MKNLPVRTTSTSTGSVLMFFSTLSMQAAGGRHRFFSGLFSRSVFFTRAYGTRIRVGGIFPWIRHHSSHFRIFSTWSVKNGKMETCNVNQSTALSRLGLSWFLIGIPASKQADKPANKPQTSNWMKIWWDRPMNQWDNQPTIWCT
jgi:hypothetical protein